jgi:hypothetical protein
VSFLSTALRRAACIVVVLTLAACGGGTSGSGAVPPVSGAVGANPQPLAPTADSASAAPTTASSPSPTATPFTVTGQVTAIQSAGSFLIQAGSGCGYLKVITTSTTQTALNGQTLKTGVYARVSGTGSCATQITATAISLAASANGPFPMPTSAPSTSASNAPVTAPTTAPVTAPTIAPLTTISTASSSTFASIVNGQQWPLSFRPFAANSPWNMGTAGHSRDANLTATLQSDASKYLGGSSGWGTSQAGGNDYGHPIYLASSSDHAVTTDCSGGPNYGCYANNARVSSLNFRIPDAARPAQASDHHIGIIQPDGTIVGCWDASYSGGTSFNAAFCATESIVTGSGVESPSPTSGADVAAGLIRADEVASGVIPHAIFLVGQCSSGYVYPGTTTASQCGGGLPIGAWIHLNLTDAQIAALPASDGNKAVLTALAHYGGFLLDTGGTGPQFALMFEDAQQYASFNQPFPSFPSGSSVNWSAVASNMEVLQHP